jgi:hypothetical protein
MVSGAISTGAVDGEGASPTASHSESETRLRDPSRRASVSRVSDDGPMIAGERPFLGCPVVGDLAQLEAEVAVLGIPHGVSYVVDDEQRGLATAPVAVREASQQFAEDLTHHDFDPGRPFLRKGGPRLVDFGDVPFEFGARATRTRAARTRHAGRSSAKPSCRW